MRMPIHTSSLVILPLSLLLAAAGCGRGGDGQQAPEAPHPASPESYMHDKEFIGALAGRQAEQRRLVRERNAVVEKMKAKIDAKRAELKTDDEAKLKAELEKDPEWNELHKKCVEANEAIEKVRKGTLGVVRERLTRGGKPVSK